jgi:hypothetical protein
VSDPLHVPLEEELAPNRLERAATWLSAACALHCLLMPLAMAFLPALGATRVMNVNGNLELGLMLFVVLSASAGAVWGYRRHRDWKITSAMASGLVIYVLAHAYEGAPVGQVFSVLGAVALAVSSFASARLSQTACEHDHEH